MDGNISFGYVISTVCTGPQMMHSHGGFDLAKDRLVSCYGFLLTCSVDSLVIVSLDVGYCLLHLIYLSLSDCISLIR